MLRTFYECDANTNRTSASTVGHKYQNSLDSLAETLDKSDTVFVRCIKSRHAKAPKCACAWKISLPLSNHYCLFLIRLPDLSRNMKDEKHSLRPE